MVRIWEQDRLGKLDGQQRPNASTLPPILPLVLYHGPTKWQVSQQFQNLVAAPAALRKYSPDFRYMLYDLSAYSDAELIGAANVQLPLWVLKHVFDMDWNTLLTQLMAFLQELAQAQNSLAYVATVLRYVSAAARTLQHPALQDAVEHTFPKDGGALMQTIAQEWIEQGRKQGLEIGMELGLEKGMEQGIERGMEQGIEKGMAVGLQRGQQHGVIQATREAIFDLLELRFKTISATVATALADIQELSRLKTLFKLAATVETLAVFEKQLQQLARKDPTSNVAAEPATTYQT
jgi:hypothetical protein